jgi:hypothetical protein
MAVSGSATSAYRVRYNGLTLSTMPTTTQNSMCTPPSAAVGLLAAGDTVTIAGSDMAELRRLWYARQGEEVGR